MKLMLTAILLLLSTFAAAQQAAPLSWQPLHSKSTAIGGLVYETETTGQPWSIQVARGKSHDAFRFEVRQGDEWEEDRHSGETKERSELDGYRTRWSAGTSVWGAYSFLVEPGTAYKADWTAIGQMHGSKLRPFHLQFNSDVFEILTEHMTATSGVSIASRYQGRLSRNVWHRVVFHLQESSANGRFEYWLDGKKIVDLTGPIGADGNLAYWKFGIYRGYGPIAAPLAVQYANMEIGNSNLSGRISTPLDIN
jgi:hypothetical protein